MIDSKEWSTITMVYKLHGDLSYSFPMSFFLSGVLYVLIVIISSRSAMKYLYEQILKLTPFGTVINNEAKDSEFRHNNNTTKLRRSYAKYSKQQFR